MAQTKWSNKVKGVILKGSKRFRTNPIPEISRALDVETRVTLNHLGVVSRRR
jgi:hypothetical protein